MSEQILSIIDELIPAYKNIISGEYAIALAGAHAKGKADIYSDLDIFVYAEGTSPYERRKEIFAEISDHIEDVWVSGDNVFFPWGGSIDFMYKGYKVETTIRSIGSLEEVVNEAIKGCIKVYPEPWTINGYYSYISLSEIDFIKPVEDHYKIIDRLKEKIKVYPKDLKKAIINEFWPKSAFWVDNFHYKSAIKRMDIIYTSGIITNTIQNIVQVLFALNEKYFYGDKKIEMQLGNLTFCPQILVNNIEFLLSTSKDPDYLEKQRNILNEVIEEIGLEIRNSKL